jgi:DNA replication protein DnaC
MTSPEAIEELARQLVEVRKERGIVEATKPETNVQYFQRVRDRALARFQASSLDEQEADRRQERDPLEDAIYGLPKRYQWASFGVPANLEKHIRSTAAIDRAGACRHATRVIFVGASGTGKTSLAVAALRARYLDEPHHAIARFVSAWQLGIARALHKLGDDEPPLVDLAIRWRGVVLIDDLGSPKSDPPMSAIPDVLMARHDAELPTWVTTWMTDSELEARYGSGIARRVLEDAAIIDCGLS